MCKPALPQLGVDADTIFPSSMMSSHRDTRAIDDEHKPPSPLPNESDPKSGLSIRLGILYTAG